MENSYLFDMASEHKLYKSLNNVNFVINRLCKRYNALGNALMELIYLADNFNVNFPQFPILRDAYLRLYPIVFKLTPELINENYKFVNKFSYPNYLKSINFKGRSKFQYYDAFSKMLIILEFVWVLEVSKPLNERSIDVQVLDEVIKDLNAIMDNYLRFCEIMFKF